MKLFRPVGLYEMEKILESDGKEFPPRFNDQPIFYPVLNKTYARQIAENWNQNDYNSGFVGFVTEFEIDDDYIKKYRTHCVGGDIHQEYWIPATMLTEFNNHLISKITIVEAYYGEEYTGIEPRGVSGFKELEIDKQFEILGIVLDYNSMDFIGTVFVEWKLINLNLLYWFNNSDCNHEVIESISKILKRNNRLFVDSKSYMMKYKLNM